jgi:hypothetical protein
VVRSDRAAVEWVAGIAREHLADTPESSHPRAILLGVTIESLDPRAICSGNLGQAAPSERLLFEDYRSLGEGYYVSSGYEEAGAERIFYLEPSAPCGGRYRSDDPTHARVTRLSSEEWRIEWEDSTDGDFNDIVITVRVARGE